MAVDATAIFYFHKYTINTTGYCANRKNYLFHDVPHRLAKDKNNIDRILSSCCAIKNGSSITIKYFFFNFFNMLNIYTYATIVNKTYGTKVAIKREIGTNENRGQFLFHNKSLPYFFYYNYYHRVNYIIPYEHMFVNVVFNVGVHKIGYDRSSVLIIVQ